jgi:DNA-binding NarL/FixJ family response regulator
MRYRQIPLFGPDDYMPVVGVELNHDWVARQRFTEAEKGVLNYLILRYELKAIAEQLGKKYKTVYAQAQSMVNKVGATSVDELVCLATTPSARLAPRETLRRVI